MLVRRNSKAEEQKRKRKYFLGGGKGNGHLEGTPAIFGGKKQSGNKITKQRMRITREG